MKALADEPPNPREARLPTPTVFDAPSFKLSGAGEADGAHLLDALASLAREAGEATLRHYEDDAQARIKGDGSPLTKADLASEAVIKAGLAALAPGATVVSEEDEARAQVALGETFFLVDPLDGTKEFISRNGEFTVNIALIEKGAPVLGVVFAPALGRLYLGARGLGAFVEEETRARRRIGVRPAPARLVAVGSRSHGGGETQEWLTRFEIKRFVSVGSSLKLCLVAAGEADLYPRLGRTMEWDVAAGDAILRAAGGIVTKIDGSPFVYGKQNQGHDEDFANPGFVAWGDVRLIGRAAG